MIGAATILYFLRKLNQSAVYCATVTYEILQKHPQPLPKEEQMTKIDTGHKYKMAVAAILKSGKRP